MSKFSTALKRQKKPGIYRFTSSAKPETLSNQAAKLGWRVFQLDGSQAHDKQSFLREAATAMSFPSYFGKNWDALEDSINDLGWAQADGYVLVWEDAQNLAAQDPDSYKMALDILARAVKNWGKFKIPFYVLLKPPAPTAIPQL